MGASGNAQGTDTRSHLVTSTRSTGPSGEPHGVGLMRSLFYRQLRKLRHREIKWLAPVTELVGGGVAGWWRGAKSLSGAS